MVLASCLHFGPQNFDVALEHLDNLCAIGLKKLIEIKIQKYVMPLQNSIQAT